MSQSFRPGGGGGGMCRRAEHVRHFLFLSVVVPLAVSLCARGNKTGLPGSQFKVVFFPWSARGAGFKTSDVLSRLNVYHADVGHL